MIRRAVPLAVAALVALAACERPEDQETGSLSREDVMQAREELSPDYREALDSGNEAYRAQQYQAALGHFQEATEIDGDIAAGWFGVYMAQLALGNVDAANAAMERAQKLAPGASLIHPEQAEGVPAGAGDSTP